MPPLRPVFVLLATASRSEDRSRKLRGKEEAGRRLYRDGELGSGARYARPQDTLSAYLRALPRGRVWPVSLGDGSRYIGFWIGYWLFLFAPRAIGAGNFGTSRTARGESISLNWSSELFPWFRYTCELWVRSMFYSGMYGKWGIGRDITDFWKLGIVCI